MNPASPVVVPRPLAQVLLRRLLLAYVAFVAAVIGAETLLKYQTLRQETQTALRSLTEAFAPGAEAAIWDYQEELLITMTKGMATHPTVVAVDIVDFRGGLKANYRAPGKPEASADLTVKRELFRRHLDGRKELLGTLTVASSAALLMDELLDNLGSVLLITLAQLLFLGMLIWLLLRYLLVQPLAEFSGQVAALRDADLGRPLDLGDIRIAELDTLRQGFNQLMLRLAESRAHIAEQNTLLERRVAERTRDLETSETTLRRAQAVAHIGSWHLDIKGDGLTWSDETCRIFGVAPGTTLDYPGFLACVHEDDRAAVDASWQAALTGADYDIVHRIVVAGEIKWVREQAELVFAADGALAAGIGTVQDITDRKLIEEALRSSETRFRSYFELPLVGIAITSLEKGWLDVNQRLCDFVGYSREELTRLTWTAITHPEDLEPDVAEFERILRGESEGYSLDKRFVRQDGAVVYGTFTVRCVRRADRSIDYFVAVVQDITERKYAELALQEALAQAQRFSEALDHVSSFIYMKDKENRYVYANRPTLELFNCSADSLVGSDDTRFFPPSAVQRLRQIDARVLELGEHTAEEVDVDDGQGHRRVFWEVKTPIYEDPEKGTIWGLCGISTDITERKRAEEELGRAKIAAEAANRSKSEFLANMSHEIRTPMNAILGLTQLVLDTELDAQQRDFLRKVHTSSRALLGILNDILDYSKIEAGRMEVERVGVTLEEMLRGVADLFEAQIEEKGLELFFEIGGEVPDRVLCDPLRLTQVLNNLVGNAIKFTERGEIHLKLEVLRFTDNAVTLRFAVRDTGIGLDKDQIERLFQAFSQADGSITRKYGGTGLGLAICQKLVHLLGGEIIVSSVKGQGATFAFTVEAGLAADAVVGVDTEHLAQALKAKRVLVVDDQDTSCLILRQLLGAWGLESDTATSGEEAILRFGAARAAGQPYEAVLLDWRMPGMDGLELARRLREESCAVDAKPLTLVMVTAYDKDKLLAEAAGLALDGVVTKPVIPSHLFDVLINSQARQTSPAPLPSVENSALVRRRFDGARILLVEDNAINREVAAEFLKKRGVEVGMAVNGKEAVGCVQRERFDLVLMDLHMPVMDGFEATAAIRALPEAADLPIVAMTAAVLDEDRQRCTAAGMVDFVAKPIDPDDLVRALSTWLRTLSGTVGAAGVAAEIPAVETGMPPLPGFDLERALRRLDGDEVLFRRLLTAFATEQADFGERLDNALRANDVIAACAMLHGLKGAAGNVGATDLAAAAAAYEDQLKRGVEGAGYERFVTAWRAALATLATLPKPAATAASTAMAATSEALEHLFNELVPYLERHELLPTELVRQLQGMAQCAPPGVPLERLLHRIDQFDNDGAMATIAQIAANKNLNLAS